MSLDDDSKRNLSARAESAVPPGYAAWITAGLIAETIRVWQRYYVAPLTAAEAAEILASVGRLFDACSVVDRRTS
jgi:hypothetical protein